jgi:hypothetical protein
MPRHVKQDMEHSGKPAVASHRPILGARTAIGKQRIS